MDIKGIESQDFDIIENVVVGLREIWKKKLLVILITIAGLLVSLLIISIKGNTTMYSSSATLFSAAYGSYNDSSQGATVMSKYKEMIGSSRVCSRAAQTLARYNLSTGDLQDMVAAGEIGVVGSTDNTYRLRVYANVDSELLILPLTNAMASAFAAELNELLGTSSIQVMDEANQYSSYNTINVLLYLLIFTGGAFVASCGIIFCSVFFSPWIYSKAQCEQDEDLILGLLPYTRKK